MEKDQQPSLDYQRPGAHKKEVGDIGGSTQRTFDRVAGPNLRLRDNLIQAGSCAAGFVMGGGIGMMLSGGLRGLIVGGVLGLLGGVLISGAVIGVYRFANSAKKK